MKTIRNKNTVYLKDAEGVMKYPKGSPMYSARYRDEETAKQAKAYIDNLIEMGISEETVAEEFKTMSNEAYQQ